MLNKYSAAVTFLILPRMSTCWASHREIPHKETQTRGHSALLSFKKPTDGSVSLFMKPVSFFDTIILEVRASTYEYGSCLPSSIYGQTKIVPIGSLPPKYSISLVPADPPGMLTLGLFGRRVPIFYFLTCFLTFFFFFKGKRGKCIQAGKISGGKAT